MFLVFCHFFVVRDLGKKPLTGTAWPPNLDSPPQREHFTKKIRRDEHSNSNKNTHMKQTYPTTYIVVSFYFGVSCFCCFCLFEHSYHSYHPFNLLTEPPPKFSETRVPLTNLGVKIASVNRTNPNVAGEVLLMIGK